MTTRSLKFHQVVPPTLYKIPERPPSDSVKSTMVRCDLRIRVRRSPCADWMDGVTATRGKHEAQTFTVLHQRHLKRAENSNAAYIPYLQWRVVRERRGTQRECSATEGSTQSKRLTMSLNKSQNSPYGKSSVVRKEDDRHHDLKHSPSQLTDGAKSSDAPVFR